MKQFFIKNNLYKRVDWVMVIFFIMFIFARTFIYGDLAIRNKSMYHRMVVPGLGINVAIYLSLMIICTYIFLTFTRKIIFDKMIIFFILRFALYIVPIMYVEGNFNIGTMAMIPFGMLAYYIGYNYRGNLKDISVLLIIFSIIIGIQIIVTLMVNKISVFDPALKWYMVTPAGNTNFLGTILLPIFILIDVLIDKKKVPFYLYEIFMIFCMIGTGSRSVIIFLCIYFVLKYVLSLRKKAFSINSIIKRIIILLILVFIIILLFQKFNEGIVYRLSKFGENTFTSNRIQVYSAGLKVFMQHVLLGRSAYAYQVYDASTAHNFILESLIQTGIIGTIIYLYMLHSSIRKIWHVHNEKIRNGILCFLFAIMIHGLVEPNLFTGVCEIYFWVIVGVGNSFVIREDQTNHN